MYDIDELFWTASLDEMVQGYIFDSLSEHYICLVCGETREMGVIYQKEGQFYEAEKSMKLHITNKHTSMFDYLLHLNKKFTGLTEHQRELLTFFYQGLSDKDITNQLGGGSTATIRNHRFKLKEKEKQAKVFLAIMTLLENNNKISEIKTEKKEFINIHKGATMVDERFAITEKEREKVLKTYFDENGELTHFPSKEKRKIIILQKMIKSFDPNQTYTEQEINEILKDKFHDFATIRRYFIEYGFMDRNKDGSSYWVKR